MRELVYLLCALTCLSCFVLVGHSFIRSRTRMLLWVSLSFFVLTINNVLLFMDLVIFPHVDMSVARDVTAAAGPSILVFGMVWDAM